MASPIELGLLLAVAAVVVAVYLLLKIVKPLILNTLGGLVVLLLASFFGVGVKISWVVLLIVALGGVPGAVLVLLLAHLGFLFEPVLAMPLPF